MGRGDLQLSRTPKSRGRRPAKELIKMRTREERRNGNFLSSKLFLTNKVDMPRAGKMSDRRKWSTKNCAG